MKRPQILLIALSLTSLQAFATTQSEINHLLDYVSKTDCRYERNGELYNGAEAVEHINKKYAYFKEDIETTEDFIKLSATKSKMSGKHYKIRCADQAPVNSKIWLQQELKRYRSLSQE